MDSIHKNKYYLYRHIREDTGEPFYIGKGTKKESYFKKATSEYYRAYCKHPNNSIWTRIVSKTKYEVEIMYESSSEKDVLDKEYYFVNLYGRLCRKTGPLSNIKDGGEKGGGSLGYKMSEENKEKARQRMLVNNPMKGKNHSPLDVPGVREKVIKRMKSKKNPRYLFQGENDIYKKKVWLYELDGNFAGKFNCLKEVKDFISPKVSALRYGGVHRDKQYMSFEKDMGDTVPKFIDNRYRIGRKKDKWEFRLRQAYWRWKMFKLNSGFSDFSYKTTGKIFEDFYIKSACEKGCYPEWMNKDEWLEIEEYKYKRELEGEELELIYINKELEWRKKSQESN